jgi:hypothetical protein
LPPAGIERLVELTVRVLMLLEMLEIFSAALPVLEIVIDFWLLVPTLTLPKDNVVGERLITGAAAARKTPRIKNDA